MLNGKLLKKNHHSASRCDGSLSCHKLQEKSYDRLTWGGCPFRGKNILCYRERMYWRERIVKNQRQRNAKHSNTAFHVWLTFKFQSLSITQWFFAIVLYFYYIVIVCRTFHKKHRETNIFNTHPYWQNALKVVKYTRHTNCIRFTRWWENTFGKKCFLSFCFPSLSERLCDNNRGDAFFRCVLFLGTHFLFR